MENKTGIVISFTLGFYAGRNWPKIEKYLRPYFSGAGNISSDIYNALLKVVMQQKEHMEDMIAAAKITKKNKKNAVRQTPKRKTRRSSPVAAKLGLTPA